MRIGLFGGSFDPVHAGHLRLARACSEQARLDQVWLVPAATQPHKPSGPVASDKQRCEMLRLAIAGQANLVLSMIEIERGGVSYTVETLEALRRSNPHDELFLLMGADTLHDLPNWRQPRKILQLALPLVVHRPGEPAPDLQVLASLADAERLAAIESSLVDMPATDISSSHIRHRVANGRPIDDCVPKKVAQFISQVGLYANLDDRRADRA